MGTLNKLSDTKLRAKKLKAGRYGDGGGLYLQATQGGSKSWLFIYRSEKLSGKSGKPLQREMGLGAYPDVSLETAREKARACRELRGRGLDPIEERDAQQKAAQGPAAREMTFKLAAESYTAAHGASWKNAKHRQQWSNTLAAYVYPEIGALPVRSIDTELVTKVLEPIWTAKPETASRVRGRMKAILDYAAALKWREGENPARWQGHLEHVLADRRKVRAVKHHAALPFDDVPAFLVGLRQREGVAALAMEFLILTAGRTSEVLEARWSEMDESAKVWTVPAARRKAHKEHRVPLTARALAILEATRPLKTDDGFVFPGDRPKKPLSNMALLVLLRRMKRTDITAHGFRSTFRDWAAERTNVDPYVVEMALAHTVSSKVEAAYRRGDLFEKRRHLMEAWERYCESERGKVLSFPERVA